MSGMDVLRERIARALDPVAWEVWDRGRKSLTVAIIKRRTASLVSADAVVAELGLREMVDGEGHYWQTPWERIEEDR